MDHPDEQRKALQEQVQDRLLVYGADHTDLRRSFATWLQLHPTDAAALIEIANTEHSDTPLTPARLSERINLSPAATSALLNRMEQAGHIVRTREHSDRRVVTLRAGEQAKALAEQYFTPLADRLDRAMAHYPPDVLRQFATLLHDIHQANRTHLDEAAQAPADPGRTP
ncbi:MarR family winged helix-turn-helix transcriptional regulator [Streptomyces sp. NPDC017529]|uniref:MarR family winged helix-turn-helix transcriptional regulator n=1 Tax=Streptomyces sp. NPDC017529 TaxID=3365000 RepID=UPI0037A48B34